MRMIRVLLPLCALSAVIGCSSNVTSTPIAPNLPVTTPTNLQLFTNGTGSVATYTTASTFDLTNPFFQTLGTNGRTCGTCHQQGQGMSLSAAAAKALFNSTNGTDPLFAAIDGANFPTAVTGDPTSHTLLTNNGLFRIAIALPKTAQFKLSVIADPYGCALSTNTAGQQVVSVYRRPLPATSLGYLAEVMWDARETVAPLITAATFNVNLNTNLAQQATDAISGHAQGTVVPSAATLSAITTFEQSLFTAQAVDNLAGSLSIDGATGGPTNLAALGYYPGINDSLGRDPHGARFDPNSMSLYTAWANSANTQQASIARGQNIFNTANLNITNVPGFPNTPNVSCSFCHDAPNLGSRSLAGTMDTGTSHVASAEPDNNVIAGLRALNLPSLPVYQITGCTDPTTHAPVTYTTSDPGKALSTGLCADVSQTKVPILRGLAARAPYFHGGSATDLRQVVAFYNARFRMGLSQGQQSDLVNFLQAL